jgi:hypothetical protein
MWPLPRFLHYAFYITLFTLHFLHYAFYITNLALNVAVLGAPIQAALGAIVPR